MTIRSILYSFAGLMLMAVHADAARVSVFVSIPPQRYFVQQIGKDHVSVQVMVSPGASPATYEPRPAQMAAIAKADAFFTIGVPFEDVWLEKIAAANSKMKIVPTDRGIKKIAMEAHDHDRHDHGSGKVHGNHLDPHIWTSPLLVIRQARNITTALKQIDPDYHDTYEANYATFEKALIRMDHELRDLLNGLGNRKFLVFHPSWGYFAKAYNLIQVPVEVEGKSPKPAHLHDIIEHARRDKIRVIFVQPQFSTKSARTIAAAIGGKVVVADPLAEDWVDNLRGQAVKFRDALR